MAVVAVYVDDLVILTSTQKKMDKVKREISNEGFGFTALLSGDNHCTRLCTQLHLDALEAVYTQHATEIQNG